MDPRALSDRAGLAARARAFRLRGVRLGPRSRARVPADAIVVLGCRLRADGSASPALARRVARGIALYRHGAAPFLVLSGGGTGAVPEAEIMRRLACDAGVPEAALIVEPRSRNTLENARETARLLSARGLRSVLLVSDRVHLPRAALLFRLAGLAVGGWAATPPPALSREVKAGLREGAALARTPFCVLFRCR
ncbi:MAG TPA: YdcF family protein [Stellaceae bacterium]|nr:YdcF family protein [Stellaceae bacterium]